MKSLLKSYRHLIALALVITVAITCLVLGVFSPGAAFLIIGLFQLSQLAMEKRKPVFYLTGFSESQIEELDAIVRELRAEMPKFKKNEEKVGTMERLYDSLHSEVKKIRKSAGGSLLNGVRKNAGGDWEVGEDCANHLGSMFVLKALADGKLKSGAEDPLVAKACSFIGVTKAAVATTDIPLPVAYAAQIVELVYVYGTARKQCTVYPLGGNSMKLPRLKTGEPQFAFINISGNVPEKVPQSEWVTFTPGKAGGIVRIPSEIDEDSIFSIGQFVARYIARQMAYWEDYCLFLGDGSGTYNNINGIGAQSAADSTKMQLAATNSSSDKITVLNVRTLRTLCTGAVLGTGKYYAHPTMEALFVSFNTSATVMPYQRLADGTATFDGFPIVWVPIMPPYSTSATLNAYQMHFGDLSWWYFGERRGLDVQTSRDVYFATDEIGIRALERFDIHLMGQKATGSLQLSAS